MPRDSSILGRSCSLGIPTSQRASTSIHRDIKPGNILILTQALVLPALRPVPQIRGCSYMVTNFFEELRQVLPD